MLKNANAPGPKSTSPQWDSRNSGFISPQRLNEMKRQSAQNTYRYENPTNLETPDSNTSAGISQSPNPQSATNRPSASSHTRTASGSLLSPRSRSSLLLAANSLNKNQEAGHNTTGSRSYPMQPEQPRSGQILSPSVDPQDNDITLPAPGQPHRSASVAKLKSSDAAPVHPEIRSVVQLSLAHAHKVYYSGPLIRHVERQPDGHRPSKDEGWRDVWAQLGGTTLSIWDMKEIEEASKRGEEVPPSYINVTDAFVQVLGSVTVPASSTSPPQKYTNVVTLNTAGSNLILFSCPSTPSLISWSAAFRLSAWEKSRLEEIYTAHLLRMSLSENEVWKDPRSPLVRGKMEGWTKIRVAGQTDWKRLWLVVQGGTMDVSVEGHAERPSSPTQPRKNRMSALFSRPHSPQSPIPQKPSLYFYASQKIKDKKKAVLTMRDVTQAFAVYPERPELISRSTLMKLEGLLGEEEMTGNMRSREGWLLLMPELEEGKLASLEMLKWLVGIHDAFDLYGRPQKYVWDPRDPVSMMFGYPVGSYKERLFLERELAEGLDPRDDRTSAIRSFYTDILSDRMNGEPSTNDTPRADGTDSPTTPVTDAYGSQDSQRNTPASSNNNSLMPLLPPLSFEGNQGTLTQQSNIPDRTTLTPITERTREGSSEQSASRGSTQLNSLSPTNLPRGSSPKDRASSPRTVSPVTVLGSGLTNSPPRMKQYIQEESAPINTDSRDTQALSLSDIDPRSESSGKGYRSPEEQSSIKIPMPVLSSASHTPALEDYRTMSPTASRSSRSSNVPVTPDLLKSSQTNDHALISPFSPDPDSEDKIELSQAHGNIFVKSAGNTQQKDSPLARAQSSVESDLLANEPGALWYMRQQDPQYVHTFTPNDSEDDALPRPLSQQARTNIQMSSSLKSPPSSFQALNQNMQSANTLGTPGSAMNESDSSNSLRSTNLGRRPSGARAPSSSSGRRPVHGDTLTADQYNAAKSVTIVDASSSGLSPSITVDANMDYANADALAALSFLEQAETTQTISPKKATPLTTTQPTSTMASETPGQFKSSFAPSKQAVERKARSQAQLAAHEAAVHKPGRSEKRIQGRQQTNRGAWESSDEEEDDEEDDEEDAESGSDFESQNIASESKTGLAASFQSTGTLSSSNAPSQGRELSPSGSFNDDSNFQRNSRILPQPPRGRSEDVLSTTQRRAYPDASRKSSFYDDGSRAAASQQQSQPYNARQSVWSSVLDANRHQPSQSEIGNARNTFVQLDSQAETMTKAFTPQGLLSAGLQDKEDRSAKKQEEIARETGASLINVPHKPPPPQTGLLGAITAHERERNREGGVGAALTERERERRLAEERQRKLDDFQRQQLEQHQQFAQNGQLYGMYGGLTPQMTGFNPMMGMPYNPQQQLLAAQQASMYFNPMFANAMAGFGNPQHMYAAQQAAQAYQQAMMSMSVAGSQIAADNVQGPATQGPSPNSMFGGPNMNMAFDPRMSMMSMGMGMPNMGMGFPSPIGMQMTGASNPGFDPRMSMAGMPFDSGLRPPGDMNNSQQRGTALYGNSPRRGNSPANTSSPRYIPERLDEQIPASENDKTRS